MRILLKMTWIELKLFVREPVTMVFTFALPLIFLFVLGGVFQNIPSEEFRDAKPMDYYTPAYVGLVIASIGLVGLPIHFAKYRERGVLRRFRASPIHLWSIFGAQVLVSLIIASVGGILLVVVSMIAFDVRFPESPALVVAAFVPSVVAFAAIGILLGALLPTTRAAQGLGLILFIVMLMLSGAGPPPELMSEAMEKTGQTMPLFYVIRLIQDPWLGYGWDWDSFLILIGVTVVAALASLRLFRWE
ncbi:MAG: ABC transporter permease [Dehalococcoidia bacterium]|nr:ABC transporter permease [Dehalococcoidia bacterium]